MDKPKYLPHQQAGADQGENGIPADMRDENDNLLYHRVLPKEAQDSA